MKDKLLSILCLMSLAAFMLASVEWISGATAFGFSIAPGVLVVVRLVKAFFSKGKK